MLKTLIEFLKSGWMPLCLDKGGGSPPAAPAAPDPTVQINAEAMANRYNVKSPFGTQTWDVPRDANGKPLENASWTVTQTLDPSQQRQFDARNAVAEQLIGRAGTQLGQIPSTPFNYAPTDPNIKGAADRINSMQAPSARATYGDFNPNSLDASAVRDATFKQITGLLDPVYKQEQTRLDQKLANQGLPIGSEAYDQATSEFTRGRDEAYNRAALNAVTAGAAEQQNQFGRELSTRQQNVGQLADDYGRAIQGAQAGQSAALTASNATDQRDITQRQQNYNELASLLGGQQLNPVQAGGTQPIDVSGAFARQQAANNTAYQGQLAAYNADVAGQNSFNNGLFGLGAAAITKFSDRRLKIDIERKGTFVPGIDVYEYRYIWGGEKHLGFMADEVLNVMPEAVYEDRDTGYLKVDYDRLLAWRVLH